MNLINLNSQLALLEVSGSDAMVFLQGQLSNDIREVSQQAYQFSAHLNNKGRILATFIISSPAENCYYLITSRDIAATIIPRLKMFVLRSKVSISLSELTVCLSDQPLADNHAFALVNGQFLNIGRNECNPAIQNDPAEAALSWHKLLVENAIPMIYAETAEKIIPQQVNYDLIGGVNFKKGCYTGQEIVARTHYLGKVKRRMVYFSSQAQPQIGQTLVSPLLDNQEVGFIVDYYPLHDRFKGLASLQSNCLNSAFLDVANSQALECVAIVVEPEGT